MKYKDFYSHLFSEIYIPVAKNFWMDKNAILHRASNHQDWIYTKHPEGFEYGGYLKRPDLYEDLYDYAYKKGYIRVIINPNGGGEHSNGVMYYTYDKKFGISNLQKRKLKDYAIENGYELRNELDNAEELNESSDTSYGYWIGKSGEIIQVKNWGEHGGSATEYLVSTGMDRDDLNDVESAMILRKRGFCHVAINRGAGIMHVNNLEYHKWENIPRRQKEAIEDIADIRKVKIRLNGDPIDNINESDDIEHDQWKKRWLERRSDEAEYTSDGKLIAYHGTTPKNAKSIKQTGFNERSYFTLDKDYAKRIVSQHKDIPEDKVVVFKVALNIDDIDFVVGHIYSTKHLNFKDIVLEILKESETSEHNKRVDRADKQFSEFLDDKIKTAPGKTREEKNEWLWKHDPQYAKIASALIKLRKKYPKISYEPEGYFIRFGDLPKKGKSRNYLYGYDELGVSVYYAKWDKKQDKWEIDESGLNGEGIASLGELFGTIGEDYERPVYLLYGRENGEVGGDGEPLVNPEDVKIIKTLSPEEYYTYQMGADWVEKYLKESIDYETSELKSLYNKSEEIFKKLESIRKSPKYYDSSEYSELRKEFQKVHDRIETLQDEAEPESNSSLESGNGLIDFDYIEKLYNNDRSNYFLRRLLNNKTKKWVVDYINLRNEVLKKIINYTKGIPNANIEFQKKLLVTGEGDEDVKTSIDEFFPVVVEVSASKNDDMAISVSLERDGRFSGVFEGNDEASPETVKLVNKLINPSGKMVKIYGTHGIDVVQKIKETGTLPADIYVSPNREYSKGYQDLEGNRETFVGYVNSNSLNQESEVDWKTIEQTEIKNFRYL